MNYYNEFDPFAAAWLQRLIDEGHLPQGHVDTRSIEEVQAHELTNYDQCHFFCGIGGWPLALRLAGLEGVKGIWTGSPPCQPFSEAGNRKGQADERHLWPVFRDLIQQCRPVVVFGEQVASAIRFGWVDDVQADAEAQDYAVGFSVLGAHSVGAPHKRQRLYFGLADTSDEGLQGHRRLMEVYGAKQRQNSHGHSAETGIHSGTLGDTCCTTSERKSRSISGTQAKGGGERFQDGDKSFRSSDASQVHTSTMGNTEHDGSPSVQEQRGAKATSHRPQAGAHVPCEPARASRPSVTDDLWQTPYSLPCGDGKHRSIPVEPEVFPLADGVSNRVGILRGAGNAIVPQVAQLFIESFVESLAEVTA